MTQKEHSRIMAAIERQERALMEKADELRTTAEELRSRAIHPNHAANRIMKLANEIARRK